MKSGPYSLYFAILTCLLAMILYILAYKTYFDVFHGNRGRGMTVFCTKKFYVERNRATGGSRSSAIGVLIMIFPREAVAVVVHQKTINRSHNIALLYIRKQRTTGSTYQKRIRVGPRWGGCLSCLRLSNQSQQQNQQGSRSLS